MKKLMTLVFASMIALTLSMPAWSQSTTGAKNQAAPAAKKDDKEAKKAATKKKKDDKKAASKKNKGDKQDTKKNATKK